MVSNNDFRSINCHYFISGKLNRECGKPTFHRPDLKYFENADVFLFDPQSI